MKLLLRPYINVIYIVSFVFYSWLYGSMVQILATQRMKTVFTDKKINHADNKTEQGDEL